MYLEYKTISSGWDKKLMLQDISRAITGTITDKASFSAACDKAATAFVSQTIAPGWSLYDDYNTLLTGVTVLSRNDSGGVPMYLHMDVTNPTAGYFRSYLSWDNSSHTGTYPSHYGNTDWTGGGNAGTSPLVLRVWAQPEFVVIQPYFGGTYSGARFAVSMPRPPGNTWWAAANGKSSLMVGGHDGGNTIQGYLPVVKNNYTSGETFGGSSASGHLIVQCSALGSTNYPLRNIDESYQYFVSKLNAFVFVGNNYMSIMGELPCALRGMPTGMGLAPHDQFVYGGKTYAVVSAYPNQPTPAICAPIE